MAVAFCVQTTDPQATDLQLLRLLKEPHRFERGNPSWKLPSSTKPPI